MASLSLGDLPDELRSRIGGLGSVFGKPAMAAGVAASKSIDVPQVPISRVVDSPRRKVGKGRRDTILTGADGLP